MALILAYERPDGVLLAVLDCELYPHRFPLPHGEGHLPWKLCSPGEMGHERGDVKQRKGTEARRKLVQLFVVRQADGPGRNVISRSPSSAKTLCDAFLPSCSSRTRDCALHAPSPAFNRVRGEIAVMHYGIVEVDTTELAVRWL